jgi:Zn-dependent M28 family amino/carboxypeptidase
VSPLNPRARWISGGALLGASVLVAASLTAVPATAEPVTKDRVVAQKKKPKEGTVQGVYEHLIELEEIGDAHGTRSSGTPGYEASVDYVMQRLRKAGYKPVKQAFEFPFFEQTGPSTFEQTAPTSTTFVEDVDYGLMTYSGSGDVTAPVQGVDLSLATPANSTSGCEASDFAGFTAGNIALIQRGACTFGTKVTNATAAGAAGVIIFNTGTPGNTEAFAGTLGAPVANSGPAIGTSFAIGQELAGAGVEVHLAASTTVDTRTTWNVIAETKQGNAKNVVMAGAHLDSVTAGHGINDNGSGSAALLETAEAIADMKPKPKNKVRFAWWAAEEFNLLGSAHYVTDLSESHPDLFQRIALYLNFDMVGSPNYMLGVYDGDDSLGAGTEPPEGSAAIEELFHGFFDQLGTGSVDTVFSGRSDYGPFIALNVPAGGLFTGAEGVKTAEEAALFGGTAGEAYDECYHAACDDLGNVSRAALTANLAAMLHAVKTYARSTKAVNGNRSGHEPPPDAARSALRTASKVAAKDHLGAVR